MPRSVCWRGDPGAAPACEQREALVEPRDDLCKRQVACSAGRQFDRERDAVEASADRRRVREIFTRHGSRTARSRRRSGARPAGRARVRFRARRSNDSGATRTTHSPSMLSASRVVASMTMPEHRAKQRLGDARTLAQDVLAIIQNEQQVLAGERGDERVDQRFVRLLTHAIQPRDRASRRVRGAQRSEVEEPHAVGEACSVDLRACRLEREARLADAAWSEQRDEPARCDQADRARASSASRPWNDVRTFGRFASRSGAGGGASGGRSAAAARRRRLLRVARGLRRSVRSAAASSASVCCCGARRALRSSVLIAPGLKRARSASASCESPAARRNSRSNSPKARSFIGREGVRRAPPRSISRTRSVALRIQSAIVVWVNRTNTSG